MTYRSTEAALRDRTESLEAELRSLEEQRKAAALLEGDVDRVVKELQKTRSLLDRVKGARSLPVLNDVAIAAPCSERWEDMLGDERARHCAKCNKSVFNLSDMTRAEAELLLFEREGDLCVQLWRRSDGTILTADCPVGVRSRRFRMVGVFVVAGTLAAAGLAAMTYASVAPPPRSAAGGLGQ